MIVNVVGERIIGNGICEMVNGKHHFSFIKQQGITKLQFSINCVCVCVLNID